MPVDQPLNEALQQMLKGFAPVGERVADDGPSMKPFSRC